MDVARLRDSRQNEVNGDFLRPYDQPILPRHNVIGNDTEASNATKVAIVLGETMTESISLSLCERSFAQTSGKTLFVKASTATK